MASTSPQVSPPATAPTRRPYRGSCHCGHVRYIAFLTLPPADISATPAGGSSSTIRLRKCNCSTCHKMSFFHVRVPSSPEDFLLLSPTEPLGEGVRDYQCFNKWAHWPYCGTCGVRCFTFVGEGEIREVEVEGKQVRGWMLKREGWVEGASGGHYLSINAATLDQPQEGLDLREWHEKGWIAYLGEKNGDDAKLGAPHPGGMY